MQGFLHVDLTHEQVIKLELVIRKLRALEQDSYEQAK
jgi:hypothetical protein